MHIISPGYKGKGGQSGHLEIFDPLRHRQYDTFSCCHCNRVVIVRHRADPSELGGMCKVCDKLICPECNQKGGCTPWEEEMRRMEARYALRKAIEA